MILKMKAQKQTDLWEWCARLRCQRARLTLWRSDAPSSASDDKWAKCSARKPTGSSGLHSSSRSRAPRSSALTPAWDSSCSSDMIATPARRFSAIASNHRPDLQLRVCAWKYHFNHSCYGHVMTQQISWPAFVRSCSRMTSRRSPNISFIF